MRERTKRFLAAVALSLLVAPGGALLASGGSRLDVGEQVAEKSPEVLAAEQYNEGLAARDRAWSLQKKANDPGLADPKREKLERKIHRADQDAVASFSRAVEGDPGMHRAWGSLGYSYRQLGNYTSALQAYGRALELRSDYAEALEYLGEAYLGLGRISDAQESYGRLVVLDELLAQELVGAMSSWIEQRRQEPAEVKIGELDAFDRWVAERLQGEPLDSSLRKSRSW